MKKRVACCIKIILIFLAFVLGIQLSSVTLNAQAQSEVLFNGAGTAEDPYLIENVEDLKRFRDMVNAGETFDGSYFYQTNNLDLGNEPWTPIGEYESGRYFYGIYNGGGHYIENLYIPDGLEEKLYNQGFFGELAGIVLNLGIESGRIEGDCNGSIASHSVDGTNPYIINCYSRAFVYGMRTGGIADDFTGGIVINSWFDDKVGGLGGERIGAITSYSATIIDCIDTTPYYADVVISSKTIKNMNRVTLEGEINSVGMLYLPEGVKISDIVPWQYNNGRLSFSEKAIGGIEIKLEGDGTKENPYLIRNYEDLCHFRLLVNGGNGFRNTWFEQTQDIVIEGSDWTPIGVCGSGNYFWGIYDGKGHVIKGLTTRYHGAEDMDTMALFGALGGVIANLGLVDVDIEGAFSATIAGQATGDERTAMILNCYSQGIVKGWRAGGIADYFNGGTIANCISDVQLHIWNEDTLSESGRVEYKKERTGGIMTVSADTKVYGCRTTAEQVMPEAYRTKTSKTIGKEHLKDAGFVRNTNIRTALTQVLFANEVGIQLKQWDVSTDEKLQHGTEIQYVSMISFVNDYFGLIILLFFATFLLFKTVKCGGLRCVWKHYKGQVIAISVISGLVAFFCDCAAVGIANEYLNLGNSIFILAVNALFLVCVVIVLRNARAPKGLFRDHKELLFVMVLVLVLELLQFDIVPRYDASIYYGSLVRGANLYRLDLFSYIGAFVCWKWMHGSALLIAPLEFLFNGEMFGVYISNVIITEVTLVLMYNVFRQIFRKMSPLTATLASAILIFCPYQLGMFTYLSYDTYLAYFAVWLLYSYLKKNNLMISFCGFLLFFSKISGGVFYVVFLIAATLFELITEYKGNVWKRVCAWWTWSKCILWVFPTILYLLSLLVGEWFTVQHFNGSYVADMVSAKSGVAYGNTLVQSFVFCFRWLFVIICIVATVKVVFGKSDSVLRIVSKEGRKLLWGVLTAGVGVVAVLLLYNSDAECPRYTAILNVVYSILVPIAVYIIWSKGWVRRFVIGALAILLLVQTYWTIDPAIIFHKTGEDTGTKTLYRLALDNDERIGMNLGKGFTEHTAIGDIYAYNVEYNFYDSMIQHILEEIDPNEGDVFYTLDIIDYEFHLNGNQYRMYWNKRLNKMTYDAEDPDSVYLLEGNIRSQDLMAIPTGALVLNGEFYLVVAERVDEGSAIERLQVEGYDVVEKYSDSNLYGSMKVYYMKK